MLFTAAAAHLGLLPEPAYLILLFFGYSLLGYGLECVVLTAEKNQLVVDRGFVRHLPFCVIYGFGGIIGYALLSPFTQNWLPLFVIGAVCATIFEYVTARLQLLFFGSLWWDYTTKPFNYKGILCLESTIGWGIVALIIVHVLHRPLVRAVQKIPLPWATLLAAVLVIAYLVDFVTSAYAAAQNKQTQECPENGKAFAFEGDTQHGEK